MESSVDRFVRRFSFRSCNALTTLMNATKLMSDVKNMVPLKVAYIATFLSYGIKFLSLGDVKNLIPFPKSDKNMIPFPMV